jgi:hypothetical protein
MAVQGGGVMRRALLALLVFACGHACAGDLAPAQSVPLRPTADGPGPSTIFGVKGNLVVLDTYDETIKLFRVSDLLLGTVAAGQAAAHARCILPTTFQPWRVRRTADGVSVVAEPRLDDAGDAVTTQTLVLSNVALGSLSSGQCPDERGRGRVRQRICRRRGGSPKCSRRVRQHAGCTQIHRHAPHRAGVCSEDVAVPSGGTRNPVRGGKMPPLPCLRFIDGPGRSTPRREGPRQWRSRNLGSSQNLHRIEGWRARNWRTLLDRGRRHARAPCREAQAVRTRRVASPTCRTYWRGPVHPQ